MNDKLRARLGAAMKIVDEHGTSGPRLIDDASRLFRRVKSLLAMKLVAAVDVDSLELACYALQLPMHQHKPLNLRDRAEQAAELLVTAARGCDENMLDKTTRILGELPHRSPKLDESRILSDAVNLDDFGITGLLLQSIQLSRQGSGIAQLIDGCEKREQYRYWEARLKDGFHFEPTRKLAKRRLESARAMVKLLAEETSGDLK